MEIQFIWLNKLDSWKQVIIPLLFTPNVTLHYEKLLMVWIYKPDYDVVPPWELLLWTAAGTELSVSILTLNAAHHNVLNFSKWAQTSLQGIYKWHTGEADVKWIDIFQACSSSRRHELVMQPNKPTTAATTTKQNKILIQRWYMES